MPASPGPNVGLYAGWAAREFYKTEMDANLFALEVLTQLHVKNQTLNTPPGSPAHGDAHIIGSAPTGPWALHAREITAWNGLLAVPAWVFFVPKKGWVASDEAARQRLVYEPTDASKWVFLNGW